MAPTPSSATTVKVPATAPEFAKKPFELPEVTPPATAVELAAAVEIGTACGTEVDRGVVEATVTAVAGSTKVEGGPVEELSTTGDDEAREEDVGTDEVGGGGDEVTTLELDEGTALLLLWVSEGVKDVEDGALLSDDGAGVEELAPNDEDGLDESDDDDDTGTSEEVGPAAGSLDDGAGVTLPVGVSVGEGLAGNGEIADGDSTGNEMESD